MVEYVVLKNKRVGKPLHGYSDTETVMLDLDHMTFNSVKYWAVKTMRWFKLEGFIILKSSKNCYHVVFNRKVSWTENMHIVAWVSLLSHCKGLVNWFLMQCIKESSTLRVSPKGEKPSPRIVHRYGRQNGGIHNFLHHRKLIKKCSKLIRSSQEKGGEQNASN
jgi:hypothetical protein